MKVTLDLSRILPARDYAELVRLYDAAQDKIAQARAVHDVLGDFLDTIQRPAPADNPKRRRRRSASP